MDVESGNCNSMLVLENKKMLPIMVRFLVLVYLIGCSDVDVYKRSVLAIPLRTSSNKEVLLARMEQILANDTLTEDERAQILYERGVLYDALGLQLLARNDFLSALYINPTMQEAFNYIGLYFFQSADYDLAYEAFDSVLELDSNYEQAYFNRGIALYYGGRYKLAKEDLVTFWYGDPSDPFRAIWIYLVDWKMFPEYARIELTKRYNAVRHEHWGWGIVEFYLGKISYSSLMQRIEEMSQNKMVLAGYFSQVYFYLGKYFLQQKNENLANHLFKLVVINNIYNFIEYRCSVLELSHLKRVDVK